MSDITKVSIDVLKIHPRNQEFFDDISGDDYNQFKSSIKEDGIISEIIVSSDMTILSGHQRFKAAKELGFKTVPIRIREDIETEDQKLKLLLAANFGRKENSKTKQRKIADEYVRLCGYKNGEHGNKLVQNGPALSLKEIAAQLGTSEGSLKRSLRIERNLTESMKQLLDDGVISETFAADVISGMTEDEQMDFISSLDITKKYTARELQPYVNKIKELKENPVIPQDYEDIKRKADGYRLDYLKIEKELKDKSSELTDMKKKLKSIEETSPEYQYNEKLKNSCLVFCAKVSDFLEKVGGYVWLVDHINELPNLEREGYIKSVNAIKSWADNMSYNINNQIKEII